jgi:hypothetical protein
VTYLSSRRSGSSSTVARLLDCSLDIARKTAATRLWMSSRLTSCCTRLGRSSGEAHFDTRMSIISGTTRCLLDSSSSSFRSVCGSVNSVLSFLLLNPVSTVYAAIRHIFLPSLTLATALCRLRGHPPRRRLHSRTWVVAALKMLPCLQ